MNEESDVWPDIVTLIHTPSDALNFNLRVMSPDFNQYVKVHAHLVFKYKYEIDY